MSKVVLVTGGTGMVGKAIQESYGSIGNIYLGSKDCDLTSFEATKKTFERYRPTHIIHLAAKVGGVQGNTTYIGDFCAINQQINANVMRASFELDSCERVVSLLSTCVYPDEKFVKYPLTEDQLHVGEPHASNFGYAYAKRMLEVQSRAYNQQLQKTKYICALPNNIYGKHDNFDLDNGHVVPAIIRKVFEAKRTGAKSISFWGNGKAMRQFTVSSDIARDLMLLTFGLKNSKHQVFNIGNTMEEISIADVVATVAKYYGYTGEIVWDSSKPSGQARKPSSTTRFMSEFPLAINTVFNDGIAETCKWFEDNYPLVRGM